MNTSSTWQSRTSITAAPRPRARKPMESASFHRTVLDEFYRVAFRKKIYRTIGELQTDLDAWITEYSQQRPHQGRWCFVKTPCRPFLTRCHWQRRNSWPHEHRRLPYRLHTANTVRPIKYWLIQKHPPWQRSCPSVRASSHPCAGSCETARAEPRVVR